MLTGGCYCGRVRYEVSGVPFEPVICHCEDCRRISGAPFVAYFTARAIEFQLVAGAPRSLASSAKVTRRFCRDCGTPLTYEHEDAPGRIDVTTASLDDPEAVPPEDHIYVRSRLSWARTADGLPEFEAALPAT